VTDHVLLCQILVKHRELDFVSEVIGVNVEGELPLWFFATIVVHFGLQFKVLRLDLDKGVHLAEHFGIVLRLSTHNY